MVRVRGGSAGAGRTTQLRDEDIEIVEPFTTKSPRQGAETRGGKRKQSTRKKRNTQTEEQQTVEPSVEPYIESSTKKSLRIRIEVPIIAQRSEKRKRSARVQPDAQTEEEPTPLPKFIDDDVRERFKWISQKGFIT